VECDRQVQCQMINRNTLIAVRTLGTCLVCLPLMKACNSLTVSRTGGYLLGAAFTVKYALMFTQTKSSLAWLMSVGLLVTATVHRLWTTRKWRHHDRLRINPPHPATGRLSRGTRSPSPSCSTLLLRHLSPSQTRLHTTLRTTISAVCKSLAGTGATNVLAGSSARLLILSGT
jgi:hypothetical protein